MSHHPQTVARICELGRAGKTREQIHRATGVPITTVGRICERNGVELKKQGRSVRAQWSARVARSSVSVCVLTDFVRCAA